MKIVVKENWKCPFRDDGRDCMLMWCDREEIHECESNELNSIPDFCPLDPKNGGPVTVELEVKE